MAEEEEVDVVQTLQTAAPVITVPQSRQSELISAKHQTVNVLFREG